MFLVFFRSAAIDHDTDGAVPFFPWGSRVHDASFGLVKVVYLRCSLYAIWHGQDFVELRSREKSAPLRPYAFVLKLRLHLLYAAAKLDKGVKDPGHISGPLWIRRNGTVLFPVHDDSVPDVSNRWVPADPVAFFGQADHVVGHSGGDGLPFHLGKYYGHIHHGPANGCGCVNVFFDGYEFYPVFLQSGVDIGKIPDIPGQPVQLVNDKDICGAGPDILQKPL